MKNKILLSITIGFMFFILLMPHKVFGMSNGYEIENYNIYMLVNEDNTFDITETITANFLVSKHGIYRKIPLRNTVTRLDGTTSKNLAKVTDISVDNEYTTYTENGNKVIKIGSPDSTVRGLHTYRISYRYNIGKDPLKNADELYFNLIGNEWDTNINKVNFTIKMPKEFDKSTLGFSRGEKGTVNSSEIGYSVRGSTITGSVLTQLNEGEALTVRLTLPEGYFVNTKNNLDIYSIIVIGLCIFSIIISYLLWKKYGKDNEVIETVEFYPPKDMNSAEVGFLYKGHADAKSIISLLIYLANEGYLQIEETEENGIFSKSKGFKITKIKEYDWNNKEEEEFFNGLFTCKKIDILQIDKIIKDAKKEGQKIKILEAIKIAEEKNKNLTSVTNKDLYDSFYEVLNKIKTRMNSNKNRSKIFEKSSKKGKWVSIFIMIVFILCEIIPFRQYAETDSFMAIAIFPVVGILIMMLGITEVGEMTKNFGILFGLVFGFLPWTIFAVPILIADFSCLTISIIGFVTIVILMVFLNIMPKRTEYGNEMLGKIKGFKTFLETAEKPKLEELVNENPEYFYNILPYTYALGVSDKWMKQFETIALQAPEWYVGYSTFSVNDFNTFMTNTMASAQTAMTSSPSSDSGGSSGGGSSGGGSGGGGGGSW